jgi:hypothetical protein
MIKIPAAILAVGDKNDLKFYFLFFYFFYLQHFKIYIERYFEKWDLISRNLKEDFSLRVLKDFSIQNFKREKSS